MPINLAVLVSGSGTTLQNLIDAIERGELDARIALVIASRDDLGAAPRAAKAKLPYEVVRRRDFDAVADFSDRIFALCDDARVDLVCCAGWLALLRIDLRYHHRMINVHPALLPSFGGHGMYGAHVHEAVLAHGCKVSGCTVHFLDDAYDSGPIILQRTCAVLDDDTPATLAARVQGEERIAYIDAIQRIASGKLRLQGRRVIQGL